MIRQFCLVIGTFMVAGLYAYNDEPSCFRELTTTFFRPGLVNEALSMHSIDQSVWVPINIALKRRSERVPTLLRQRADHMRPSPLEHPFQPAVAGELLRQILLQVFTEAIHDLDLSYGSITNEDNIKEMFGYIRRRQESRLRACLGENAMQPNPELLNQSK